MYDVALGFSLILCNTSVNYFPQLCRAVGAGARASDCQLYNGRVQACCCVDACFCDSAMGQIQPPEGISDGWKENNRAAYMHDDDDHDFGWSERHILSANQYSWLCNRFNNNL